MKLLDNGGTSTDLNEKQLILRNLKASWLEQSEAMVKAYFGLEAPNVNLEIVLDQDIENATAFVTGSGSPTWINLELHLDVNDDSQRRPLVGLAEDTSRNLDDYFATGVLTASDAISSTDDFAAHFQTNGAAFIGGLNLADADTGAIGGTDASGGSRDTTQSGVIPNIYNPTDDPLRGFNEIWPDLSQTVSISLQSSVSVNIQAGSTADDTLGFAMTGINTSALGLDVLDISIDASTAVGIFDIGIEAVGQEMARLGALQNRFQSALANASIRIENTSASKSRIADADYAAEVAALTRQQILTQAATAMIAQAGASNQLALQLLS